MKCWLWTRIRISPPTHLSRDVQRVVKHRTGPHSRESKAEAEVTARTHQKSMQEPIGFAHVLDMPRDILISILTPPLGSLSLTLLFRCTSRRARILVDTHVLPGIAQVSSLHPYPVQAHDLARLALLPNLRLSSLVLRNCRRLESIDTLRGQPLSVLWLLNASSVTAIMTNILLFADTLETLDLSTSAVSSQGGDLSRMVHSLCRLRRLTLRNCDFLRNLDWLSGNPRALTSLDVAYCTRLLNIDGLAEVPLLTALCLKGCRAVRSALVLCKLSNLIELQCQVMILAAEQRGGNGSNHIWFMSLLLWCQGVDVTAWDPRDQPRLESIEIGGALGITCASRFAQLPRLTSVDASHVGALTNPNALLSLSSVLTVNISGCPEVRQGEGFDTPG